MTDQVTPQAPAEAQSVPVQTEATAATVPASNSPESHAADDSSKVEEKKFSQAELDAIVGKRVSRERAKIERDLLKQREIEQLSAPTDLPSLDQFDNPQAYSAFIRAEAKKLIEQEKAIEERYSVESSYKERQLEALDKYPDFVEVAHNQNVTITQEMADIIKRSEVGPDLAYHLGLNIKEAARIAELSPLMQARELGKIEAKLISSPPPAKKTTAAPEPIKPVSARITGQNVVDTTDPRSTKTLSTSDWIAAERARQVAKHKAQNHR